MEVRELKPFIAMAKRKTNAVNFISCLFKAAFKFLFRKPESKEIFILNNLSAEAIDIFINNEE